MIRTVKIRMFIMTAVVLLSVQATGCGASQSSFQKEQDAGQQDIPNSAPADQSDIEEAAQHLLTVWSDYMDVLEKMYASELWALDYVDAYLESGDWNDLVKARTACIASARYLTELSMTEEDLSEEEYLILTGAGVDTGYQTVEFLSVPVFLDEAHNVIRNQLLEELEYSVYFESSIETLKAEVAAERDSISSMCQYACVETNYLLLTLGDNAVSETYWSSMEANYPVLTSGRAEWLAAEAELMSAADACMDAYEGIVLRQSELVSMMEAELYQMTQDIESGDLEALAASTHAMVNVPDLLPFPAWYNPSTAGYLSLTFDEDDNVTYPESGDDLADARHGVYMQVENVSEEEIAAYIDTVQIYAEDAWKSEDSGSWYISMPEYHIKIDCGDDTATIFFYGEDITFAPVWYIR